MNSFTGAWVRLTDLLDEIGAWIAPLSLRIVLAWEFFESGLVKYNGSNWFGSIQDRFLFPFNLMPPDISWFIATWFELAGGILILLGLFTRFWAVSLSILTVVAIAAVHWGIGDVWAGDIRSYQGIQELLKGYAITNMGFGNYKLPLIYLVMFIPLIFTGPGKLSLDYAIRRAVVGR